MGLYLMHTHQRFPTTARREYFWLLGYPSGPFRTSLVNLATSGSPKASILTPSLVRTPDRRATSGRGAPALKPSSSSGLALASMTGPATEPSH